MKGKINWPRLVGMLLWFALSILMMIIFFTKGIFDYSFVHFYLPLIVMTSFILFVRRSVILSNRRRKIYRALVELEIQKLLLEKNKIYLEILQLREKLKQSQAEMEREKEKYKIVEEMIKQEIF